MKTITKEWLESKGACWDSLEYVIANNYIGAELKEFIKKLMSEDRFFDANWLIVRRMNKKQCVRYAIYAAKQVLHIYEDKCPNDSRLRKAIEAAKAYIKNPCKKTKDAAYAAATAAYAAWPVAADAADADAADAAATAAADADAADAAATAAADAAWSAWSAAPATYATEAAAYAAAADEDLQNKILNYGMEVLNG